MSERRKQAMAGELLLILLVGSNTWKDLNTGSKMFKDIKKGHLSLLSYILGWSLAAGRELRKERGTLRRGRRKGKDWRLDLEGSLSPSLGVQAAIKSLLPNNTLLLFAQCSRCGDRGGRSRQEAAVFLMLQCLKPSAWRQP